MSFCGVSVSTCMLLHVILSSRTQGGPENISASPSVALPLSSLRQDLSVEPNGYMPAQLGQFALEPRPCLPRLDLEAMLPSANHLRV